MTKVVNDKGQIWSERNNDVVTVGFTRSFLDSLDQCWHILPANLTRFREKAPLMVVETNDTLISIMSPVSAHYTSWSDKAQNFPYKLTEEDVVLELNMVAARATQGRRGAQVNMNGLVGGNAAGQVVMNWDELRGEDAAIPAPRPAQVVETFEQQMARREAEIMRGFAAPGAAPQPPLAALRRNRPQDPF